MNPTTRICTVADIGSNTVKCSVFRLEDGGFREIAFFTEKLGLIARVRDGALPAEDVSLLARTLGEFREKAAALGSERFFAYATASLRGVSNFAEVDAAVLEATGAHVALLPAAEEARLSFKGFYYNVKNIASGVMADMGGGSTELVAFGGGAVTRSCSMDFGCLTLYRRFVSGALPNGEESAAISEYVAREVTDHGFGGTADTLCLIGGTGRAVRKLMRRCGLMEDDSCGADRLEEFLARMQKYDPADVDMIARETPARTETVIPGLIGYCAVARAVGAKEIFVGDGSLRDGCMLELIEKGEV